MTGGVDPAWRAMRRRRGAHPLALALMAALCLLLIAAAGALGWAAFSPDTLPDFARPIAGAVPPQRRAAPPVIAPPPVEPVRYLDVAPDDARRINAAVPFSTRPNPAAAPLRLRLASADAERATDCLAAAAWYEAGDDAVGQQAVVQVVLNRLRHPSFPKSVCGVVFQGSERRTGCQFSFTCDGALARTPSPAAWSRARGAALAGLGGLVFGPVGWATHYHTDWVVPYWSKSVDKIAEVHTHLFFRWKGTAGNPAAFTGQYAGAEPIVRALARLSPAHAAGDAGDAPTAGAVIEGPPPPAAADGKTSTTAVAPVELPVTPAMLRGNALAARNAAANSFAVAIADNVFSGDLAMMALDLCALHDGAPCTVTGAYAGGGSAVDFYYFRDRARGRETALWNCDRMKRPDPKQCMPPGFRP